MRAFVLLLFFLTFNSVNLISNKHIYPLVPKRNTRWYQVAEENNKCSLACSSAQVSVAVTTEQYVLHMDILRGLHLSIHEALEP